MDSISTSGSETDDEGEIERAIDGDASESVAIGDHTYDSEAPNTTKKRVVMTRRERNEGMRSSLTGAGDDSTVNEGDEEQSDPQPFIDKPLRVDADDAAAIADKIGCSRASVRAIRLNKVPLPSLLAADAQFLTSIGVEADDQGRLLKALHATNREKWESSSVVAPPSRTSEDSPPFSLPDMCSMLSNSTLHLNCVTSGLIDAQRLLQQYRRDKLLKNLGYQDAQNVRELKNLVSIMKSSATTLCDRLDELKWALEGEGGRRVMKSPPSNVIKYGTIFGICALTTAFVVLRLRHPSV